MQERGLAKFAGLLFIAILVIAGIAYLTDDERPAEAASSAAEEPVRPPSDEGGRRVAELEPPRAVPAEAECAPDGAPRALAEELRESSGIAASRAHAGIAWTHNDSGDPLLFAIDAAGRTVGRVRVTGATVEDWEDVAHGPCPAGGDCLFVADIGDNDAERASVTVYRIPEPAPSASASAPAAAIRLRYPDGAHDAEAMFILGGAIHVVTKGESGPIAIYRAPVDAAPGAEVEMTRIRTLAEDKVKRPQRITSADASADGRWVALRTLREVAIYPAAQLAGDGPLSPRRIDVTSLDEEQGEGLAFAPDGSILLTSEGDDRAATVARLACRLP